MLKRGRSGFLSMEIIIFLIVIGIMTPLLINMLKATERNKSIKENKEKIRAINNVFERVFFSNKQYAEQNCYGWDDPSCSALTITPTIINQTTLGINTYDDQSINTLISMGCEIKGAVPNFQVSCHDGFGKPIEFEGSNLHTAGQPYTDPYQGKYPEITLKITNMVPIKLKIDKVVDNALSDTQRKIGEISNGIKSFVRSRRLTELTNICGSTDDPPLNPAGGLSSMDDAIVPYVWSIVSQTPNVLCQEVENTVNGCGCSNHDNTSLWENDPNFCVVDDKTEMERVLTNLSLGKVFEVDGLGNKVVIVPLANETGDSISNCPPPRPQDKYPISILPKSRVGVKDGFGNWVYYVDVFSE